MFKFGNVQLKGKIKFDNKLKQYMAVAHWDSPFITVYDIGELPGV